MASLLYFTDIGLLFAIEQWGFAQNIARQSYVTMPLNAVPQLVVANDTTMEGDPLVLSTWNYRQGSFMIDGKRIANGYSNIWGHWIAICH